VPFFEGHFPLDLELVVGLVLVVVVGTANCVVRFVVLGVIGLLLFSFDFMLL